VNRRRDSHGHLHGHHTGDRAGADVPQLYLSDAPGEKRMRLLGFERVELQPGEARDVTLTVDPRLLARFDGAANQWRIADGEYEIVLGKSARDPVLTARATLAGRLFGH
jgi:beta-glucosidase